MIISGLSIQDICVITLHIDEDLGRRDIIVATAREVQNDFQTVIIQDDQDMGHVKAEGTGLDAAGSEV